eukprot:Nitzschia sp. Nitz4//scaffold272_size25479//9754//11040//NITZ4_008308-RA/size25479-processed-gene-0.10-mRNA-1//-1//CDS//3329545222//2679//frame0
MFPSVADFLQQVNTLHPVQAIALGNPAGDADSLISAIASAYIDTVLQESPTLPLLSIPLVDLRTQRPETKYLLQVAGVSHLDVFKDVQDDQLLATPLAVTLVDHNQLTLPATVPWKVHAINDHHYDEGAHLDTCGLVEDATTAASCAPPTTTTSQRVVAFDADTSSALVASTCTLLVERWRRLTEAPIPPSLAILLYGVILLDSINLLPQAGKVTPRDQAAVQYLQTEIHWNAVSGSLPQELQTATNTFPDPTKLFDTLQNQKFHPDFWAGLTAAQALRLDFKSFSSSTGTNGENDARTFGVSTVLQPMKVFLTKSEIWEAMAHYCLPTGEADFFGIMFTSIQDGVPERQLLLASLNRERLVSLIQFLESNGFLQIHGMEWHSQETSSGELHVVQMEQANSKASRKQVAPVLMDYYKQQTDASGEAKL